MLTLTIALRFCLGPTPLSNSIPPKSKRFVPGEPASPAHGYGSSCHRAHAQSFTMLIDNLESMQGMKRCCDSVNDGVLISYNPLERRETSKENQPNCYRRSGHFSSSVSNEEEEEQNTTSVAARSSRNRKDNAYKGSCNRMQDFLFNISALSVVSKWRGDSGKLVKASFELARHHAPSMIFLDEIDAIISQRGEVRNKHEASRRSKTKLLIQMDCLQQTNELVFTLVNKCNHLATHRGMFKMRVSTI